MPLVELLQQLPLARTKKRKYIFQDFKVSSVSDKSHGLCNQQILESNATATTKEYVTHETLAWNNLKSSELNAEFIKAA
jgi:hypothetical protein